MAMGLAVTWCDTPRRLMGRAALHQQGPNEVRHRFSPRDHDNVKVPQRAICENDGGRTSPAQLMDQPGIKLLHTTTWMTLGKSGINTINRPSVDHEKDTPILFLPRAVWPHTHRTTQVRWETQEATLSNTVHWDMFLLLQVWRQSSARTQSMFYGEGF